MDQIDKEVVNILFVDDEIDSLYAFQNLFRKKFNIIIASSGQKALKILEAQPFQVIITDQRMPDMTGVEFLIKAKIKWPDPKYILLTAYGETHVIKEAINEAGIFWYMNKPYEPVQMDQIIINASNAYHTENKFKESEEKFRDVFNSMTDVFSRRSLEGKIEIISPSIYDVTGYTAEELIGHNISEFYVDPQQAVILKQKILESKRIQNFEAEIYRKDGNIVIVSINAKLSCDNEGNPIFIDSIFREITELKDKEKELRVKEAAIASSINAIGITDLEGKLVYVNDALVRMWGFDNEKEILGRILPEFWEGGGIIETVKALNERGWHRGEDIGKRKDGSLFHVDFNASMIEDKEGKPINMFGSFVDISDRKRTEEEKEKLLHQVGERLKELECMYTISNSTRIREKLEKIFEDTVIAIPPGWHYPEITRGKVRYHDKVWVSEPFEETEWKMSSDIIVDGQKLGAVEVFYLEECPAIDEGPFMKEERNLINGIAQILSETLNRRKSEEHLRESRENYRTIVEQAQDGIVLIQDGKIKFSNTALTKLIGYAKQEIENNLFKKFVAKDQISRISEIYRKRLINEDVPAIYESVLRHKNGQGLEVELNVGLSSYNGKPAVLGIIRDIADRKKAEREILKNREHLNKAQDIGKIGSWELDLIKDKLYWSEQVYNIFELDEGEVNKYASFLTRVYSEDRDYVDHRWQSALQGEPYDIEHRVETPSGLKWVRQKASVEFDDQGNATRGIGVVQDITERKNVEIQIIEYQQRLKDLANEITVAEEKMRKQIAVDLHDHVGQMLTSSRMQLVRIIELEQNPEIAIRIKNITQALYQAIQATRDAIFILSPPQLNEIGLYGAVHDWMKEQIEKKHDINTSVTGEKEIYDLEENTRFLVFRSIRELMLNVVKHARASRLKVDFKSNKEMLEITVQDDGVGFNYNPDLLRYKSNTYGLFSIQERIIDLGGTLIIDSVIDKGTKVKLLVPFKDDLI